MRRHGPGRAAGQRVDIDSLQCGDRARTGYGRPIDRGWYAQNVDEGNRTARSPEGSGGNPAGSSGRVNRGTRRKTDAAVPRRRAWVSSDPPDPQASSAVPVDSESPLGGFAGHLHAVTDPVANAVEPFVDHVVTPVAEAIGSVIDAASQAWLGQSAVVGRRVRRMAREPLANLYEIYPEARLASPRELGMRFVPVEDIRGTAVAGISQRGGDFLPLKPFRGDNWESRWQRIRHAFERMQPLPPVDLIKFDGDYWVVDGHNRVAATLYTNGVGLDAMVTELVPLDGQISERPTHLLALMSEAGELRAAAQGHRPAMGMRQAEMQAPGGAEILAQDAQDQEASERYPAREPHDPEVSG